MISLEEVTRQVESADIMHAMRFEYAEFTSKPLWMVRQIPAVQKHNPGMSYDTALMVVSTSWGYYQMLGANVYALGYQNDIGDFLQWSKDQLDIFTAFCKQGGFDPDEDVSAWDDARLEKWADYQNGPGDIPGYIASIKAVIAKIAKPS